MIVFPNCKINLGLRVLQKRGDGFHDIETVFYPIPFKDALELTAAPGRDEAAITNYGLPIYGEATENLCIRAWQLLKKDFPTLPAVEIHLLKNIPMGAGLGGGSADGAFMLQLLNNRFHLQLSEQQLLPYALQLGSDCPFFVLNQPAYATGRGEILQPVSIDLSGYSLALASPAIHINTGWAFAQLDVDPALNSAVPLHVLIQQPVQAWRKHIVNDFERPVFHRHPQLKALKEELYAHGALYAAMSGSGSTVFGLFENDPSFVAGLPPHYRVFNL